MPQAADVLAYPIPTYRFRVTVGQSEIAFSGVSGLEMGVDTIEYKDGKGGVLHMPGQKQAINITLKRGVFKNDDKLYKWMESIMDNQMDKRDIQISLTNETGTELLVTWNVAKAFPTKLTAPSFDATSNEIAVEELTLTADRLSVEFH